MAMSRTTSTALSIALLFMTFIHHSYAKFDSEVSEALLNLPAGPTIPVNDAIIQEFPSKGANSISFTIKNNCPYPIWPATLTSSGPQLSTSGLELASGSSASITALPSWSGRIWTRTFCSHDPNTQRLVCATGDCASGQVPCNGAGGIPPATLIEFTLNGGGNNDFYDVSLVDGFNLPANVVPTNGWCRSTSCPADVNRFCPGELAVRDGAGNVIGCKSACLAFNKPEFCCSGDHGTPESCPPSWYANIFKSHCPQAYSYAYDDRSSTFTCPSGSTDYLITFCP